MMYIKSYLKFSLIFLFKLITKNPVKVISCIIGIITFHYAGTFDYTNTSASVVSSPIEIQQETKKTYLYISEYISENSIKHNILEFDNPIKIVNNKIIYQEYSGYNIACWVFFGISCTILCISFFVGLSDDDVSWNLSDCQESAISSLIHCEMEDGKYYYIILGRLLCVKDEQINLNSVYRNVGRELGVTRFSDLHFYPEFQTRQSKREKHLNKLGL